MGVCVAVPVVLPAVGESFLLNVESALRTVLGETLAERLQNPLRSRAWLHRGVFCSLSAAELTAAHFGGGGGPLHKKTSQQHGEEGQQPKSRKELIEELIAKSRQEKVRPLPFSLRSSTARRLAAEHFQVFSPCAV